jgi:hypothetical protein
MRLHRIAWVACLWCCGFAWAGGRPVDRPPLDVTYCQLAKNPSSFMEERIRIRAIYIHGFEVQLLKSLACCSDPEPKIGVEFDVGVDDRSRSLFRRLDTGMGVAVVVFVGRLSHVKNVSSQLPSGDRLQLNVDRIERVEKSARTKRPSTIPKWVPKDCATGSVSG